MDQQHQHKPKSQEFVKSLAKFFKRDLISIPLMRKHAHQLITQRSGLKVATLELDTSAYPNIDYIAGNRLSVYPSNPADHVSCIMKHLIDDLIDSTRSHHQVKRAKLANNTNNIEKDPLAGFVQLHGKESLRLALSFVYDITAAPSRDLLRLLADHCQGKENKMKLLELSKSDENWERWLCQSMRTLKGTLDEFGPCKLSARSLLGELSLQQPRQYSLSSIKSSKRHTTQIIVFQHRFSAQQMSQHLQNVKEREQIQQLDHKSALKQQVNHVNHSSSSETSSEQSSASVRSIRSVATFSASPISTQQVRRVPSFSGPLMSLYASSSLNAANLKSKTGSQLSYSARPASQLAKASSTTSTSATSTAGRHFEGLCSSYLLGLALGEQVVCEFVENPRFTLKGNRERPLMMIGQDVGVVAFRPFWQQRAVEHDRAQVFYELFKDLIPKKFGEMQLVCLTGGKSRVEDLFQVEIESVLSHKILSSASYINRQQLSQLLELASVASNKSANSQVNNSAAANQLLIESKELLELGNRICRLLMDQNGCLYTCCDAQMTQAIEILIMECMARNEQHHHQSTQQSRMSREKIMALLPKWKGRKANDPNSSSSATNNININNQNNNKFLFTLENPFERAQIVQEIYDSSI